VKRPFFHLILSLFCASSLAAEERFWTDNKLTPDQPFPAAVRAVYQSWVGYELLLEEIGGSHRLCIAQVYMSAPLTYTLVKDPKQEVADEPKRKEAHWIYVSPAIEIDRFSWSLGPFRIGRIFGDDDVLRKVPQRKDQTK
jgi:hypothetical protein